MAIAWYERIQLAQTLKYNKLHDPKTGKFATQATGSSSGNKRKKGGKVGRQFAGARIAELHTSSGSGFGLGPQQVLGHVVGERRHIFALLEQNTRRV